MIQFGPFGAKGIGEPGSVPTAPAIANAIYDAIGVRIKDLPITPEKVLTALKEKGRMEYWSMERSIGVLEYWSIGELSG